MPLTLLRHATQKPPPGVKKLDASGIGLGLIGCWLFDNGSGPLHDYAGGQPGTLNAGPTWSAEIGGALAFNGSSQYISGTGLAIANGPFSISALIRGTTFTATPSCLVSVGSVGSTDKLLHLEVNGSGFGVALNFWADDDNAMSTPHLATGSLYRVTATYDSAKLQSVYLLGDSTTPVAVQTRTASANFSGDTTFRFGARNNGPDHFLAGSIYDVFVWNRALSLAEVVGHNAEPYAMFQTRPAQRWFVVAAAGGGGGGLPFFMQGDLLVGGMQSKSGGL